MAEDRRFFPACSRINQTQVVLLIRPINANISSKVIHNRPPAKKRSRGAEQALLAAAKDLY
jgi:hypothetical protein